MGDSRHSTESVEKKRSSSNTVWIIKVFLNNSCRHMESEVRLIPYVFWRFSVGHKCYTWYDSQSDVGNFL